MPTKPEILSQKIIASTRIFRVEELEIQFPNGKHVQYERLTGSGHGAVLVVPVLHPDTLMLIREYAGGMDRYELAFPKGRIEQGESVVETANRELREEIGFGAKRLEHIRSLSVAPGYIQHTTHVVVARDLYSNKLEGDEPEAIEVVPWKIADIDRLLEHQDFTEARSIAALFLARRHLQRNPADYSGRHR